MKLRARHPFAWRQRRPGKPKSDRETSRRGRLYGRLVDDQPVDGPGGFSMVHIDPAAEVVGLRSIWRPLGKRLGKVKIKPPEAAMEGLRKRAEKFRGDTTVVKATFGYFELGPIDSQTSIEPVYAFVYIVRDGEVAMKSAYLAHAGDKTFGTLLGKRRFVSRGPKGAPPVRDDGS